MIPPHYRLQYSEAEIAAAVAKMGTSIGEWAGEVWHSSHTDILAVPVLRGGIFFFADLLRRVGRSMEMSPIRSRAYITGENEKGLASVQTNVDELPAKGRSVLLVDDICDSGRTLLELTRRIRELGAVDVRCAVLIRRQIENPPFEPDWIGFEYPGPEWFVGYGMDDAERWSNLPAIHVIQRS